MRKPEKMPSNEEAILTFYRLMHEYNARNPTKVYRRRNMGEPVEKLRDFDTALMARIRWDEEDDDDTGTPEQLSSASD